MKVLTRRGRPRLAMIAHDGKKVDLVAFATYNRALLVGIATADLLVTSSLLTAPD